MLSCGDLNSNHSLTWCIDKVLVYFDNYQINQQSTSSSRQLLVFCQQYSMRGLCSHLDFKLDFRAHHMVLINQTTNDMWN
jgi:hypothetical protein